jgi:hypothetical protein
MFFASFLVMMIALSLGVIPSSVGRPDAGFEATKHRGGGEAMSGAHPSALTIPETPA